MKINEGKLIIKNAIRSKIEVNFIIYFKNISDFIKFVVVYIMQF